MPHGPPPRYRVRRASGPADLASALALRSARFRGGRVPDRDGFDARCEHILIEDSRGLACTFRTLALPGGAAIGTSYAARRYDLGALSAYRAPMIELGRFCARAGAADPDLMRVAWGALGRIVEARGAGLLFGCSSFEGTDPAAHADAFGLLAARHLAPPAWAPGRRGDGAWSLVPRAAGSRAGLGGMPPLLRSYLALGGWVSDHAVTDRDLGTMHVFTGLEIALIPPARLRALRGLAAAA